MIGELPSEFGFAAAHDVPIPYLQRIRTYYEALGYGAPYGWAHYAQVPFHPLKQAAFQMPRRSRHHGFALSAGQGRSGAGRPLQCGGEVLHRLFGRYVQGP